MKIKELVIDRAMWGQGVLFRQEPDDMAGPKGSMCCLGWLSRACGVSDKDMYYMGYPSSTWVSVPAEFTDAHAGRAARLAAGINDGNKSLPDKEAELIKLFADNGIALSFVGTHWSEANNAD